MMIINVLGLLLIAAIVWWFWLYQPKEMHVNDGALTIVVENGVYAPARVSVPGGKPLNLTFVRKDASPCASTVVFADLGISEELPVDSPRVIRIPALDTGVYSFTCQMQMYRGELVVE